jgi:hypothetical protein
MTFILRFFGIQGIIGNTLVEVVPVPVTAVPDHSHHILESAGHHCRAVVFQYGNIDEDIAAENQLSCTLVLVSFLPFGIDISW